MVEPFFLLEQRVIISQNPLLYFFITGSIFAMRNALIWNIRNSIEQSIELYFGLAKQYVEPRNFIACYFHFGDDIIGISAAALNARHFIANGVALIFENLDTGNNSAPFVIER